MGFTPMMRQYLGVKENYKECILFYRLGDFYEMFFDDAITASRELELTLTGKDCGMKERAPMCGVPFHSADTYVTRLVEKGYKVAICEQVEDPSTAKGIVKREVIRVVTPATVTSDGVIESSKNNFLAAACRENGKIGLAFLDFSTGELFAVTITENIYQNLINELTRFAPSEAIINDELKNDGSTEKILNHLGCFINHDFGGYFEAKKEIFDEQFGGKYDTEFGMLSAKAVCAAVTYIKTTQKTSIDHISKISYYTVDEFMNIDASTRRNLELTQTMRTGAKKGSLLGIIDMTKTSMGGRMLRRWVEQPLVNCKKIKERQDGIQVFFNDIMLRSNTRDILKEILDIERLTSRIVCKTANARDLVALKSSLKALKPLKQVLFGEDEIEKTVNRIDTLEDLCAYIEAGICDEPPVSLREGKIIRDGFNDELDNYRYAMRDGKGWLAKIEATERERTGIKNLKIGFNRVFGYYIEVSRGNVDKVPEDYIRKQTLTNGERYITEELKNVESTILGAEEKSIKLEYSLFEKIRDEAASVQSRLLNTAKAVAQIDCLCALAEVAAKYNYCRPEVDNSDVIEISAGRHPVVEMLSDEMFVPNDTYLNETTDRLAIITGPNMAGKSTYMRQVAVITLLAQIGSFVPAKSAHIGVADSIYTRVGASDDLASGQSTFMVEMSEVANILKNATHKSLIVYDEIGRGTSTYDGLAIAWAVVEHTALECRAKTLFATHYHELTEIEDKIDGIKNYSVAIKKRGEDIVFLRKIIKGPADGSFGIDVAKLAGIPKNITNRADEILEKLESGETEPHSNPRRVPQERNAAADEMIEKIRNTDVETLTPIECMNLLYNLKKSITEEG